MKKLILTAVLMVSPIFVYADATPGQAAPTFEIADANGKVQKLSDYAGKWVVLEWFNKDCPFVKKHYGSKNMQALQEKYTGKGVNWLTVVTSAKVKPEDARKVASETKSAATAVLMDSTGSMGKAYGAKTTPHMYVIDPKGTLVYAGAIDDNDSSSADVIPKSKNYVVAALDAGLANKKIETASTRPYGCSVKY